MHLLDVNGPAHIFHEATEHGAPIELHFISLDDQAVVESSAGLKFTDLKPFHQFQLSVDDFVFIPGLEFRLISDSGFLMKLKPFLEWIKLQYQNGANICSVCTGAFLLAETGMLDGNSCTTHWKYITRFTEKFPKVGIIKNRLFVVNERVYTSGGVCSGIDLALYLLQEAFGHRLATDVARDVLVYFRRSGSDPQLSIFLQYRNHLEDRIHHAQDFINNNISKKFSLEEISETVNMSSRNLTRLFKETTGITIGAYLEKIRLERAVQLLADGNKLQFVAQECGLKSTSQLKILLKNHQDILSIDHTSLQ